MSGQCGPRLEWAVFPDGLKHVSAFTHLAAKRDRPRAACPVCGQEVAMRLGPVKVHHFYHLSGQECPGTTGESLLHLNTKCFLRDKLLGGSELRVELRCSSRFKRSGRRSCNETSVFTWLLHWTDVRLESRLGRVIPDLVLFDGEAPVGLVEVCVANHVDFVKRLRLEEQAIPWVEVDARSICGPDGRDFQWNLDRPLPVMAAGPDLKFMCTPCHAAECSYVDPIAQVVERIAERVTIFGRFAFVVPCDAEGLTEAFDEQRWAHLVHGDVTRYQVARWIRASRWRCPGELRDLKWATWDGINSSTRDVSRIGLIAQLGLLCDGVLVGLVYFDPAGSEQRDVVREDGKKRGVPWILLPISVCMDDFAPRARRRADVETLLRMATGPSFSNTVDSSERRLCLACTERLLALEDEMARMPMEHSRVHRIRSFKRKRDWGTERIGWLMVIVNRRNGLDQATSLVVREGQATFDGRMNWTQTKVTVHPCRRGRE
jgi:hypothetical protein